MIDILGIDLGTNTGYCYNRGDELFLGTWCLAHPTEIRDWGKTRKRRTEDPRIGRLCNYIDALGHFEAVVFEDVEFASSTFQVQLWASLRASLWLCSRKKTIQAVPVGTLKKFATGDGSATKEKMEKFFRREQSFTVDDNAIDAYFLHKWGKQHIRL